MIAGSGSITVLCGCDDTHYELNLTTVSRSVWRRLQGVTDSSRDVDIPTTLQPLYFTHPPLSSAGVIQKRRRHRFVLGLINGRRCHRVCRRRAGDSPRDGRGADQRLVPIEELPLLGPEAQDAGLQVQTVPPALLQGVLPQLVGPVVGDDLGERDAKRLRG